MDDKNPLKRRKVLKTAGVLGTVGVGTTSFSDKVDADHYEEEDHRAKYSKAKEVYYEDCDGGPYPDSEFMENSGVSLVYFSTFENHLGEVLHHFGTSGHVATRWRAGYPTDDDWSEVQSVAEARLNVWNHDDEGSLLAPREDDQRMVGATPEDDGTDYNFDDAAYTAMKEVLSQMHPAISAVIGAQNVVDELMGHEQDVQGQRVEYSWDYSSWTSGETADASNFCRFYVETDKSHNEFDVQVESDMDSLPSPSCPKKWNSDDNTWAALRLSIQDPKIESEPERTTVGPEDLPPGIPEEFKEKGPVVKYQKSIQAIEPKEPPRGKLRRDNPSNEE